MKKIKDFILSIILPRKTAKYRNMHFLLAMLIYLIGMFLALGSQFIMSKTYVEREMERTEFVASLSGAGKLNMQDLDISSDENLNLDPTKEDLSIDTSLCLTEVKNNEKSLVFGFLFLENLPKDLDFDDSNLTDKEKKSLNYLKNGFEDYIAYQNNEASNRDWLLLIFNNNNLYYYEGLVTDSFNANSQPVDYLLSCKSSDLNFEDAFIYLNRLQNVDPLNFINHIYMKLYDKTSRTYTGVVSTSNYDDYTTRYFKKRGIYHKILNDKDDLLLDLTVVIDPNLDVENEFKFESFDYEGYAKQKRKDNTTYILCVFGAKRFFYLYDLGEVCENGIYKQLDYSSTSIFEMNGTDRAYYLPSKPSEIKYNEYGELDTRQWTELVGKDDKFNPGEFLADDTLRNQIDLTLLNSLQPVNRHLANFHNAIYTTHSRSYLYSDFIDNEFSVRHLYGDINVLLQKIVDTMINIDSANYELIYAIMAFGIFIIFPLIMAAIVWLMSKKLVMQRYRQYYAIGSITYGLSGLLAFIIGFFVAFDKLALILMFIQAWYFIFVTFRINTDPSYNNPEDDQTPPAPVEKPEEFKKVTEYTSSQIG